MAFETISIIIPAYNAVRTLQWTLSSIRNSTYPQDKLEVIVVDNNSTDDLLGFLKGYPEVNYILEPRQGRSFARNSGIEQSTGELVAFLDADVYIDPDWLETLANNLKRDDLGGGGARVVPTNEVGLDSLNKFRMKSIKEETDGNFTIMQILAFETPMLNSAACMYKRAAVERVGGFDTTLERHEDIDLSKRVFYSGYNLFTTWKTSAFVHYHGESWGNYFARAFRDGLTKVDYLNKWQKYIPSKPVVVEQLPTGGNVKVKKKSEQMGLVAILGGVAWLVKNVLEDPSPFWGVKFLVMCVQFFGRLWGKLFLKNERASFEIPRNLTHLEAGKRQNPIIQSQQFLFFDNFIYSFCLADQKIQKYGPIELIYLRQFYESDESLPYDRIGKLAEAHILNQLGGEASL
ncbi:MAG: glycosyltransferase [Halobacteriovoraceae bacterium]|nr:glycosyltransferase [Halobacteriovoraceae bacterium]